jgi:hypothetical protein
MKRQSKQSKGMPGINAMFVLKSLLIGLIGSVLLIISYAVMELAWLGLIVYNEGLKNIYLLQWGLLIFLIPAFTGALAVLIMAPQIKRYTYAIAAGMISGILTGIGFSAVLSLFVMTLNFSRSGMTEWQAIHDTLFPILTGTMLISLLDDLPYTLMFILLSIMLSAVGGSAFYTMSYYARAKKSRAPGVSGKASTRIIAYMAIILMILAIIPPAAAFAGIQAGLLQKQGFHYTITAQRPGDDSIMLTNNGGEKLNDLDPSSPFLIYIGSSLGGYDMTSQTAAAGMNVTLDSPGGLGISPGSTLTIKGPDIKTLTYRGNSTGKRMTHVMVIGNTKDGLQLIYLDTSV